MQQQTATVEGSLPSLVDSHELRWLLEDGNTIRDSEWRSDSDSVCKHARDSRCRAHTTIVIRVQTVLLTLHPPSAATLHYISSL